MRIGFECWTATADRAGVGHYAMRLGQTIAADIGPDDEIYAITNGAVPEGIPAAPSVSPLHPVALWMHYSVPRLAQRLGLDIYHFTANTAPVAFPAPYVVTIHDMSVFHLPETHPLSRRAYHRLTLRGVARRARRVITDSEPAGRDIVRILGVPESHVVPIPLAADSGFRRVEDPEQTRNVRERYGLDGPFLLYVGSVEPRKNLARLLEAFARTEIEGVTLAIAGKLAWRTDAFLARLDSPDLRGRVRMLGYVPTEDLPVLYSSCEAFVYPSLYEGFGLPVLEAMQCGAPVITSTDPAIAEVEAGAARSVDPLSVDAIAQAITEVLGDANERARLSAAGMARARQFSWHTTAQRTLDVYREAIAGRW